MAMIRRCSANIINKFASNSANIRTAQSRQLIPMGDAGREIVASIAPNYMYVEVSGLHGDVANSNGDFFKWSELLKYDSERKINAYESWKGKDNLLNHIETKVVGDIVDAYPLIKDKSINMLIRTCTRRAWDVCESVRKGSITDVSMGTVINHSFCNICDNKANTEDEWCGHLKERKGQFIHPDNLESKYRDKFPKGVIAVEDNRGVFGIEVSWITVGEGADPEAKVINILAGAKGPEGKQFNKKANYSKIADRFYEEQMKRSA